jgi:hypothetical protein
VKPRHAAALALAYLMLPPQLSRNPLTFDVQTKISKWYFAGIYDSVTECEAGRKNYNEAWLSGISRHETRNRDRKLREVEQYQAQEKCVAKGDPRLEGKGLELNVPYPLARPATNRPLNQDIKSRHSGSN